MLYNTANKFRVLDARALQDHLLGLHGAYYVYVLCKPPASPAVRPFYVGIGQGERVFAHEREADDLGVENPKVRIIRSVRASGEEILRYLDGVYAYQPWHRESELIAEFGLLKDGNGLLANEQRYSPSVSVDGIELRKYAANGNALPTNFVRRDCRLVIGPRKPAASASVYGKIYAVLDANPGVTGAQLVELLLDVDFSGNATIYAQSGQASRPWLAKYIDGGFYAKNRFLQELR